MHRVTHTENERSGVANFLDEQRDNDQTTCTTQKRNHINRLVGENCTAFNEDIS